MHSSLVMQLMFVDNIRSSKYRIHKYRKFFIYLRKMVPRSISCVTNSPSSAKAFNKLFSAWTDKSVHQNNQPQLFKEPTKRSLVMRMPFAFQCAAECSAEISFHILQYRGLEFSVQLCYQYALCCVCSLDR